MTESLKVLMVEDSEEDAELISLALNRGLRKAVGRREGKILEGRARQNERRESLGVRAGGVAHDCNTLLVGIMGNSSLMIAMLPASSPLVPLLNDIVLASQRAADL